MLPVIPAWRRWATSPKVVMPVTSFFMSFVFTAIFMPVETGLLPKVLFVLFSLACGFVWSIAVWNPMWKWLISEIRPVPLLLAGMGVAGSLLFLPFALIELIAEQSVLVAFFAGIFGGFSGLLGALVLCVFRQK